MPPKIPPRFALYYTGPVQATMERWAEWARSVGIHAEYEKAVATLRYRLEHEADEWGEKEKDLSHVPLQMRRGTVMMLDVRYALHMAGMQVFVTGVEYRRDHPTGRPPE